MTLNKMLVKRSQAIWKDVLQLSKDRKYTFVTFMISQPGLISPPCVVPCRELLSLLTAVLSFY